MNDLVMAGYGYADVMAMPWTLARDFAACVSRARRRELVDRAVAARLAQADRKTWREQMRKLGG